MKRRYSFLPAAALLLAAACSPSQPAAESDFTRFVDPKIGTGGHGHVFVGANVPFGMVQARPHQHSAGVGLGFGVPPVRIRR